MNFKDLDFRVWDEAHKRFFTKNKLSFFPANNKATTLEKIVNNRLHLAILFGKAVKGEASMDIKNYEFELFTGFRDKNYTKIYEGDIITDGDETYPVVFESGAFQAGGMLLEVLDTDFYSICGNIHKGKKGAK